MVTGLRELAEALEAGGAPRLNGVRRRKDGQLVVDAWPSGMEALLWGGFRGELWLQPGKEATQVGAGAWGQAVQAVRVVARKVLCSSQVQARRCTMQRLVMHSFSCMP